MTLRTFLCQNIKISRAARYLTITDNVVATLGSSEPKSCNRKKKKKKKKTKPQEGKSDMFRKRLECDRVFPHGIRNFFFDFKFSSELCNSQ